MDGLLCVLLLLWLPIGQLECAQSPTSHRGVKGCVMPTDPLVGTGDTLIINCTFESTGTLDINASSIFFKFGRTRLDAKYVHMVDRLTAQLHMPNMTRDQNSGHIFCYAAGPSGESIFLDHVAIQVAEYPVTPNITECRVYNWQKMICRWEPATQDTGIATNQTLYWTLLPGKHFSKCPHVTRVQHCTWLRHDGRNSFRVGSPYYLTVVVQSRLVTRNSNILVMQTNSIVQPNPIKNLSMTSVGKTHLQLTWMSPAQNKRILYKVTYKSPWMANPEVVSTNKTLVILQDLTPFALYNVTISCIPLISEKTAGFWSNSTSIELHTLEDVPGAAPVVTPGGFVTTDKGANKRSIVLYWTPVPAHLRHGRIMSTRIRYSVISTAISSRVARSDPTSSNESEVIIAGGATYQGSLMLRKDRAYKIIVDVMNKVGYNDALSQEPVMVEKESAMPAKPSVFTVQGNSTGIYLNWTAVDGATSYTIYWCEGSLHDLQCKGNLMWRKVDGATTSLATPLYTHRYTEFIFAISVEKVLHIGSGGRTLTTSTGMLWSDCTYAVGKEVKAPKQVKFSQHQESESLRVEWTRPSCTETGYISHFLVVYCIEDHCEERRVDPTKKEYQISGLLADETYKVKVISESPLGLTASSKFIEQKVHRSGLTRAALAGIGVAAAFVALFIIIGIIATIRRCKKSVDHYKTLQISPPERPVTSLPPQTREEDDDHIPDALVDGSVPYFVPNHSGQSRLRENFENDELERDHHNNVYPGRHHSSRCQSVDSGPDASIYSVDTVMSTLESSAGSRMDDVFVDPSKGSARFYSIAPANSLDIVPEEMALLNNQTTDGVVGATSAAPPGGESDGDGKIAAVSDRLLEQNGDIDDSMLESATVHNLHMLLPANNNLASRTTGRALKGDMPPLSQSRARESRENSVQSDDGILTSISPYCQVGDVPNGNTAGTALSGGGYVRHGSVLIAGGVDNRNNANNCNNMHLGGATSLHSSEGDNLNAPFFITEESDCSAMVDGVLPSVDSAKTSIYNNGVDSGRNQGNGHCVGDEISPVATGMKHSDSHPRLNSAGYVTEIPSPSTPPGGGLLRPTPAAGGYVTLDNVIPQSDPESGSEAYSPPTDPASPLQCVTPLPHRDSYSSDNSGGRDDDPVHSTSPAMVPPGATQCRDNPDSAYGVPVCFKENHIPCDSRASSESSSGHAEMPPGEDERLAGENGTSSPNHNPKHGSNGSCSKTYQDPGYTQVADADRWPPTTHNVPSSYVTLPVPPILQNGVTGATTS